MRKRVQLVWSPVNGWFVNLPTYQMIAGTWLPIRANLIHKDGAYPDTDPQAVLDLEPTVEVEIPDNFPLRTDGQADERKLRQQYKDHPTFGRGDYAPPILK
jgi:hypothetical protein